MSPTISTAIVGCGNIAGTYVSHMQNYPQVDIAGFADIDQARAKAFAAEHGGTAYESLEELLADDSVELVVNLTIHHVHAQVIRQCLEAGKHVHTEKPFALSYDEARDLVALAERKGLRLSCAPINYMGEAQQTLWKLVRDGRLGTVRVAYAEVNHGRIEAWHPNPEPFYDVGALWDVGVYAVTLLTAMLGPVRSVTAAGDVLYPDRQTKEDRPFHIATPDFSVAALRFENGALGRLTSNFYVKTTKQQEMVELHGDDGSAVVGHFQNFAAPVEFAPFGQQYEKVPLVREPFKGCEYGRAIDELTQAMLENRPHRASASHAAHVIEVLQAVGASMREGHAVEVGSSFEAPELMPWAMETAETAA